MRCVTVAHYMNSTDWAAYIKLLWRLLFVLQIFVVGDIVFADHLGEVPVRLQLERELRIERPCICGRVFDREVDRQCVRVNTAEAFHKMQVLAVWVTSSIEPRFVIETDRVGNECIPFPLANRIPHPSRAQVR